MLPLNEGDVEAETTSNRLIRLDHRPKRVDEIGHSEESASCSPPSLIASEVDGIVSVGARRIVAEQKRRNRAAGASAFLHLAGLRAGVSRGELEEAVSLALILRQATAAVSIEDSEICLCLSVSLIRGELKQARGLGVVLRQASGTHLVTGLRD
jgi:hypothetical protein